MDSKDYTPLEERARKEAVDWYFKLGAKSANDVVSAYAAGLIAARKQDHATIAALRAAGDAMFVQLQAMALDYRDAMLAKGGSQQLHPAHAEPMDAWTALTTKTEQP